MVSNALSGSPYSELRRHPVAENETVHRFRVTSPVETQPVDGGFEGEAEAALVLPPELAIQLPKADELPPPLSPSGAAASIEDAGEAAISGVSPVLDPDLEPSFAIARGLAMHRLLQMLPEIAQGSRDEAARRYLARTGAHWAEGEREAALASVSAILDAPRFAPLFAEASRAEVAVMGTVTVKGSPRSVSGKIDRLAVTDDEVLIVDYKTNRPTPASLEAVPAAYVAQLALYRALLQPLYPGRRIAAVLLYTETPLLIEIPQAAMDEALVRLTQP
jgi:ATP-dependent helicase/nuclease subunit A